MQLVSYAAIELNKKKCAKNCKKLSHDWRHFNMIYPVWWCFVQFVTCSPYSQYLLGIWVVYPLLKRAPTGRVKQLGAPHIRVLLIFRNHYVSQHHDTGTLEPWNKINKSDNFTILWYVVAFVYICDRLNRQLFEICLFPSTIHNFCRNLRNLFESSQTWCCSLVKAGKIENESVSEELPEGS